MPTIHLIDSEKGGTGKSWFSRVMHHTLEQRGIAFIGVDADTSNPTYHNVYSETQLVPFSIAPKEEDLPDVLFDMATQADLVVSLPAQAHRAVHHWIVQKDVIETGKAHGIHLRTWWISDGEDDSLNLFCEAVEAYAGAMDYVFVKNQGRCDEWAYFDSHTRTQEILAKYKIPTIEFPKLSDLRRIPINAERQRFADAAVAKDFGVLGRGQVTKYLQVCDQLLDTVGAFNAASPAPSETATGAPQKKGKNSAQAA
ncbi:mobilization protein MobD-like protein [filamentous cyanobacterium LEGE 11480]|uniref:Mobilization protein MobD-like protein n=1 Tax=Romeriopsis navalis LEGE 11480 TaxID=2777977 RepID=A0A928VUP6_9CYAN|nr:mobilization protein MobD-like protein [Romeriopsis navalis]MBE9032409.1 mobilization protein MobD-like protein [Romeriopsis navalis LEGE 11480]